MERRRILYGALGTVLLTVAPAVAGLSTGESRAESDLEDLERRVYRKVNEVRSRNQTARLRWNESVASEARRHARNMARKHFFSHVDPQRGELAWRLDESGIEWNRCAENIYEENGLEDPAGEAIRAWLKSPGHRRNMMDPRLSETGVGAAGQEDGTIVLVQVFIKN